MSLHPVSVIHINIHNIDVQANTVLSSGRGGRVTQGNGIHHRLPVSETYPNPPNSTPHLCSTSAAPSVTERRVEAQPRIRRKLEEVSIQPGDTLSHISIVALLATGIMSAVEQKNISFDGRLVDLAMDAHAVAYIAVVSSLHRRPRMSRKRARKLTELLDMIHTLLVEAAATKSIVVLLKKFVTRNQRKVKMMCMHGELLNLLRKIERNNDADVLSSLNAALDYYHQHSDDNAPA